MNTTNLRKIESNLSLFKDDWAVAELELTYSPKQRTGVFIKNPEAANQVFRAMWDKPLINIQEQFCALFLNENNEVIGFRLISTGKAASKFIDFNLLASCSLLCRASSIIIATNHTSGDILPTKADKEVTLRVKSKLDLFDIKVSDHLIITERDFFSFAHYKLIVVEQN